MKLSEHYTMDEFVRSATANERGIDNSPTLDIIAHLSHTAMGMEQVRTLLGAPIKINSGYRCPELNAAVRGAKNSAHMEGHACDFVCPGFGSPLEIVKAIAASDIDFDKCIQEGQWTHISFDPRNRRTLLTAHFDGNGNATYTNGVTA